MDLNRGPATSRRGTVAIGDGADGICGWRQLASSSGSYCGRFPGTRTATDGGAGQERQPWSDFGREAVSGPDGDHSPGLAGIPRARVVPLSEFGSNGLAGGWRGQMLNHECWPVSQCGSDGQCLRSGFNGLVGIRAGRNRRSSRPGVCDKYPSGRTYTCGRLLGYQAPGDNTQKASYTGAILHLLALQTTNPGRKALGAGAG